MPQTLPNPTAQRSAPAPLALWHLASLDAPTVAVVWSGAFAWSVRVHLPLWVPSLLFLVVWPVYIGDRLLDARSALRTHRTARLRPRHIFHWRQRRILVPLAALSAAAAAVLILVFMPTATRQRDSVLALAALAYLTRVHAQPRIPRPIARLLSPLFTKEFLVGLLFAAGCALPALGRAPAPPPAAFWLAATAFALLAWLNCHAIELWESAPPPAQSQLRGSFRTPILLAVAAAIGSVLLVSSQTRLALLLLTAALSALLLALLHRLRSRFNPITLRAVADLVLLTPVLLIPAAALFR